MRILQIFFGTIILAFTTMDIIWSTLWVDGGSGPISDKVANFLWKNLKKFNSQNFSILNISGPIILVSVLLLWILSIWVGWSLIFIGGNQWLIDVNTQEPISIVDTVYYTGYVVFTLGNGEYTANSGLWKIITNIASGSGMIFLTMGASYIISILNGVVQKRSLSSSVLSIGKSPHDILKTMWNGEKFIHEDAYFQSITSQLSTIVFQHKAYPLLRYYHTNTENKAMPLAVVTLDETLSILQYGIKDYRVKNNFMFIKLRKDLETYLEIWHKNYSNEIKSPLAIPDLNTLKGSNMPLVEQEEFNNNMKDLSDRRKKLKGLLKADNWTEKDIYYS